MNIEQIQMNIHLNLQKPMKSVYRNAFIRFDILYSLYSCLFKNGLRGVFIRNADPAAACVYRKLCAVCLCEFKAVCSGALAPFNGSVGSACAVIAVARVKQDLSVVSVGIIFNSC